MPVTPRAGQGHRPAQRGMLGSRWHRDAAPPGGFVAARPTRRVVLAAAVMLPLAAVSGCDGPDVLAAPPSPAPDVTVLRGAIAAEQLMITRYTTVLHQAGAAGGSLAGTLQPLLAEHRAHLAQ